MSQIIPFAVPGTLGNITGDNSDGVLAGILPATNPTKVFLKGLAQDTNTLAIACDGTTYTDDTAAAIENTADDMTLLPATPAVNDAYYLGIADKQPTKWWVNLTTQGVGTWTVVWEYWNGTAYTALSGVTDNTTGFTAATGFKSIVFTAPTDWEENTVLGVEAYWVRGRVSAYSAVTTQPLGGQAYAEVAAADATWTDDTTDATDAGASDVGCTAVFPVVGDQLAVGHATETFNKIYVNMGTAAVATYTITPKYWDGDSWEALTTYEDDSAGFTTGTGAYYIHFVPPDDWASTTVNGQAGYFIALEVTAFTSLTTQGLATQIWVLLNKTGATGIGCGYAGTITEANMYAQTKSATNADSVFLLLNTTQETNTSFTWTKGVAADSVTGLSLAVTANDGLVLVQVTEDGTTELADVQFLFDLD